MFYIYSERTRRDESNGMSDGPRRCPGAICEQVKVYILWTTKVTLFDQRCMLFYTSIDGEFFNDRAFQNLVGYNHFANFGEFFKKNFFFTFLRDFMVRTMAMHG